MIDFDKLAGSVQKLEKAATTISAAGKQKPEQLEAKGLAALRDSMKAFMTITRDILMMFLKDRKEPIRPGRIFRDAAAKSLVPGDTADFGDMLLIRWGGGVTPVEAKAVHEDAVKASPFVTKLVPILKAYRKET